MFGSLINLQILCLDYNQITIIPEFIGNLIILTYLELDSNLIKTIPAVLGELVRCKFILDGNPIEYIPPNVQRLLNKQRNIKNFYDDTQNVHNHNIQESIRTSIYSILNDKCDYNDFLEDNLQNSLL